MLTSCVEDAPCKRKKSKEATGGLDVEISTLLSHQRGGLVSESQEGRTL